jgi:Skp family chaperone for outer membrane proteins
MKRLFAYMILLASLAACGTQSADQVATVDVARISAHWPKFMNYQNQLTADADVLERAHMSEQERKRQSDILQKRYDEMQDEVTGDVRRAAEQIAIQRRFKLVTTRETLGYGGVDITADVEKFLKITETSPKPTP